jgi:hypothetical protein
VSRYVAIRHLPKTYRTEDDGSWQDRPTIQAIESDPTPVATGLVDASGTPLYRTEERVPIGFHVRSNAHD